MYKPTPNSCSSPPQSPKMRRNGFELKMQERYSHFLAADSEAEMEEWVLTLKQALQSSSEAGQDRRNGGDSLDCVLGWFSMHLAHIYSTRTHICAQSRTHAHTDTR